MYGTDGVTIVKTGNTSAKNILAFNPYPSSYLESKLEANQEIVTVDGGLFKGKVDVIRDKRDCPVDKKARIGVVSAAASSRSQFFIQTPCKAAFNVAQKALARVLRPDEMKINPDLDDCDTPPSSAANPGGCSSDDDNSNESSRFTDNEQDNYGLGRSLAAAPGGSSSADASSDELGRFNGSAKDDYGIWRLRIEWCLRSKGLLPGGDASEDDANSKEVKDIQATARGKNRVNTGEASAKKNANKASAMVINALGDQPLRVCQPYFGDPLKMLEALDKRYKSELFATRIATMTSIYSKRYSGQPISEYIDEYVALLSTLEQIGKSTAIPETHKVPMLLASFGNQSGYDGLISALMLKSDVTWDEVSAHLIQESTRM